MIELLQIDSFADQMFKGNPAGVCLLQRDPGAPWMQSFAEEMNLSETAFVWRENRDFRLRWFTPQVEVRLCGHATLAAAHALWQTKWVAESSSISFHTLSGVLKSQKMSEGIALDFPSDPALEIVCPPGLAPALGLRRSAKFVGQSPVSSFALVELESSDDLMALKPDFTALAKLPTANVIVTTIGRAPHDFYSRFFAPGLGIPEDPVTGAAHCILAPYWSAKLGKTSFLARQLSRRGGELAVHLKGDRVQLVGSAVTVFHTQIDEPRV
jgi:PhzF family phenazine biosynthesis protein